MTKDLVRISRENFDVIIDIKYATDDNVCGVKMYSYDFCFLHTEAAEKLQKAIFFARNIDLKLKIFDSFRPIEVQEFMYQKFPPSDLNNPLTGFVSDPKTGRIPHCRGVAVDLTLCDLVENELEMGSKFDEFSDIAWHGNVNISKSAQKNRFILLSIMRLAGFDHLQNEWWHYQLPNPRDYEVIEADRSMVEKIILDKFL
jgi:D-alanyl-D-alanine dipeptidase